MKARSTIASACGRVLVVDDQEDMCWVLSKILSDRGHEVRTAQTGAKARACVEGFEPEVAVVDYRLPDTNGLDLIDALTARQPRLLAILMTSFGNATLKRQVCEAGLIAYFDKPFCNDRMIQAIEDAIARQRGELSSETR